MKMASQTKSKTVLDRLDNLIEKLFPPKPEPLSKRLCPDEFYSANKEEIEHVWKLNGAYDGRVRDLLTPDTYKLRTYDMHIKEYIEDHPSLEVDDLRLKCASEHPEVMQSLPNSYGETEKFLKGWIKHLERNAKLDDDKKDICYTLFDAKQQYAIDYPNKWNRPNTQEELVSFDTTVIETYLKNIFKLDAKCFGKQRADANKALDTKFDDYQAKKTAEKEAKKPSSRIRALFGISNNNIAAVVNVDSIPQNAEEETEYFSEGFIPINHRNRLRTAAVGLAATVALLGGFLGLGISYQNCSELTYQRQTVSSGVEGEKLKGYQRQTVSSGVEHESSSMRSSMQDKSSSSSAKTYQSATKASVQSERYEQLDADINTPDSF